MPQDWTEEMKINFFATESTKRIHDDKVIIINVCNDK